MGQKQLCKCNEPLRTLLVLSWLTYWRLSHHHFLAASTGSRSFLMFTLLLSPKETRLHYLLSHNIYAAHVWCCKGRSEWYRLRNKNMSHNAGRFRKSWNAGVKTPPSSKMLEFLFYLPGAGKIQKQKRRSWPGLVGPLYADLILIILLWLVDTFPTR